MNSQDQTCTRYVQAFILSTVLSLGKPHGDWGLNTQVSYKGKCFQCCAIFGP